MSNRKKLNQRKQAESNDSNQNTPIPLNPSEEKRSDDTNNQHSTKNAANNYEQPLWEKRLQNWAIVVFTGILTFYTARMYDFSVQQANQADKVIKTQETFAKLEIRAYLSVSGVVPKTMKAGKKFEAVINYVNIGKTPAYQVAFAYEVKTGGTGIYEHEINKAENFRKVADQAVGAFLDFNITVETGTIISRKDSTDIMNGNMAWFVYGKFTYIDKFGESHFTRCCFRFAHDKNTFEVYDKYNDAD